jgi:predicted nucleic acid-binding protein
LDENDVIAVPEDLSKQVPAEDLYLIQIYCSTKATALVTTDEKLYTDISNTSNVSITVNLRQDFLKEYIEGK